MITGHNLTTRQSTINFKASDTQGIVSPQCCVYSQRLFTGISDTINEHNLLSSQLDNDDNLSMPKCNKDTGEKKQLQRWTRGHFFIVRAGGHIDTWQPLYEYVSWTINLIGLRLCFTINGGLKDQHRYS